METISIENREMLRGEFEFITRKNDYSYNETTNTYNLPDHAASSRHYPLVAYNDLWDKYQMMRFNNTQPKPKPSEEERRGKK